MRLRIDGRLYDFSKSIHGELVDEGYKEIGVDMSTKMKMLIAAVIAAALAGIGAFFGMDSKEKKVADAVADTATAVVEAVPAPAPAPAAEAPAAPAAPASDAGVAPEAPAAK
jgi:hypothetical protein